MSISVAIEATLDALWPEVLTPFLMPRPGELHLLMPMWAFKPVARPRRRVAP